MFVVSLFEALFALSEFNFKYYCIVFGLNLISWTTKFEFADYKLNWLIVVLIQVYIASISKLN